MVAADADAQEIKACQEAQAEVKAAGELSPGPPPIPAMVLPRPLPLPDHHCSP